LALVALLAACAPATPAATEPQGPADLSPCNDSEDPNVYQPLGSDTIASFIYQRALLEPDGDLYNLGQLPGVQLDAYLRFVESVQQWTTFVDIPVGVEGVNGQEFVRLTFTFLSPELIEMVLLNHYLGEAPVSGDVLIQRMNEKMSYFENRGEIVFLLTFTSSYKNFSITDPNAIRINANIDEIKLFDTNGKLIPLRHYDPHLGQACCVSRVHLSGYIGYPMFVHRNKKCTATLNRKFATTMTLQVGKFVINDHENPPMILTLRYRSLLEVEDSHKLDSRPILDGSSLIKPEMKTTPPLPVNRGNGADFLYWQNMASYIWWYLASP